MLTSVDTIYIQADIVQVVGETGKKLPTELSTLLQIAKPSLVVITSATLTAKQRQTRTASILESLPAMGEHQIFAPDMMAARAITRLLRLRRPTHPYIVVMALVAIMGRRGGHHAHHIMYSAKNEPHPCRSNPSIGAYAFGLYRDKLADDTDSTNGGS